MFRACIVFCDGIEIGRLSAVSLYTIGQKIIGHWKTQSKYDFI